MTLYLYDPRTNISTETSYGDLEGLTGKKRSNLMFSKSRGSKLRILNCYITDENLTLEQRRIWYAKETYPDEHWITVEGSNNQFRVSNYGRIKRIYKNKKERFMLPFQRKGRGNRFVKIRFFDKLGDHKVGHIVAHHFIGPKKENYLVTHKNNIITDDFAGNLEYVTKEELGKRTGFRAKSKPVVQLCLITGNVMDEYRSAREAGRNNFMSYQTVLDNCNKKTKTAAGVTRFMFLEDYEKHRKLEIS